MFKLLQDLLKPGTTPEPKAQDPRLMAAALFIHLVVIDDKEDPREVATLTRILKEKFALSDEECSTLVEQARAWDQQSVDLYGYTRVLKHAYDKDERIDLIKNLWDLVLADGHIDPFEENLVWRVAELIGISSRERVEARQAIEQRTLKVDQIQG